MTGRSSSHRVRNRAAALFAAGIVVAAVAPLAGCAINPATGKRQLALISEAQEIEIGRENDTEMVRSLGLYPDTELSGYIEDIGQRLAADSERPHLEWTFRLVDDPVINAFALPGGFIYITRGILAYMDNEAELASVIGHEIGHVTARHSVNQMSKQQLAQIGLVAGTVAAGKYGGLVQDLGGAGLGLAFLKFSRDDETQADELGLRYLVRSGYDPRPMANIYTMLGAVSEGSGDGRVPALYSTHPEPEDRRENIEQAIAGLEQDFSGHNVRRDEFLARLDGLPFGEDPREGFFQGAVFLHPDMKFRIDFPAGWRTANQRSVVGAVSPSQDATVQLTLANRSTAQAALDAFFTMDGVARGPAWVDRINGLPAASSRLRAVAGDSTLRGYVAMIEYEGVVFQVLGLTHEALWESYEPSLGRSVQSFQPLTDAKALGVAPRRIKIVRPDRDMDLPTFARKFSATVELKTLAVLNQIEIEETLKAGQPYKVVVGGDLP